MENNKKNLFLNILLVVILLVFVVGISFAAATWKRTTGDNTVNTGSISMSYVEPTNALILENALPMSDEEGKSQTKYFEFTVSTHATTNANDDTGITIPYEINISDIELTNEELAKYFIKLNLSTVEGNVETEVLQPTTMTNLNLSALRENATKVYEARDVHKNGSDTKTTTYRLRAWLDKNYAVENKVETKYQYKFRVNVNSTVNAVGVDTNTTTDAKYLSKAILDQGIVSSGDGLYVSNETNTTQPTYYYHGAVEDNYVSFANLRWRVVRINEDGTIKIILEELILKGATYNFNINNYMTYDSMYYSNSDEEGGIKKVVDDWYSTALEENYDSYIATTNFCESAKVKTNIAWLSGNATMVPASDYTSDFECPIDGHNKQFVSSKVGLINIDELVHARGIINSSSTFYLSNLQTLTMSPSVSSSTYGAGVWRISSNGVNAAYVKGGSGLTRILPVISLKANTLVTGTGASDNMWVVQ